MFELWKEIDESNLYMKFGRNLVINYLVIVSAKEDRQNEMN